MSIVQEMVEAEFARDVTDADFSYPEHIPDWLPSGVCKICGRVIIAAACPAVNDLGGQDPAPRFGADEYLSW